MNRLTCKILRYNLKNCGARNTFTRNQSSSVQEKSCENGTNEASVGYNETLGKIKVTTKHQKKLPTREPLLKNFFIGKVDKELLPFPEVIPRDDMSKLNEEIREVREYFLHTFNVEMSNNTQCVEPEVIEKLKKLGAFGNNIAQKFGGNGYFSSESLIATEPATISTDVSHILSSHYLVADVLEKYGNDDQKERILPHLADGSIIATEAVYESSDPPEDSFCSTSAEYNELEKEWIINGEKCFIVNGKKADLYLIIAQTSKLSFSGDISAGITLFLVDGSSSGVERSKQSTLGCNGSDYSTVKFQNVTVPESAVVGAVNEGNDLFHYLLRCQRLRMSLVNFGLIKRLINHMTEHCITKKQGTVFLKDMDIIGRRMSDLLCKAFALESMIYYTAGLIDEFDNQDVILESAVTKMYSLDSLWTAASSSLDFMGPSSLLSGHPAETILRDAAQLYTHGESNDSLCLYVGLIGLQHAGINIHKIIQKDRNPLFHPGYILRKILQQESIENPKPKWQLNEQLHPTLHVPSQWLELSISRLQLSSEMLLTRYGTEVIEKHFDIKRMAEMVSLIYSMFTSLSRASRSYCIGLKCSDYEMLLATVICYHAQARVNTLAMEIGHGPFITNDKNHSKIAKQVFKGHGYFFEHPTTYNF